MEIANIIPELRDSLNDYKAKRSAAKSAYNKYKRIRKKYEFLDVIIKVKQYKSGIDGRKEDDQLEIAVKDLFNSISIKSHIPKEKDNFDIKASFNEFKWGLEIKNGNLPSENEMFQAFKYSGRSRNEFEPILIWNNSKTNQEFDAKRIEDAVINNYGILTTKELRNGYLKLKANKISLNTFVQQLNKKGLIKYSSKSLGKSINSEITK